jgi:hypothetical protein
MSNVFHEEVTQGDESSTGTASASAVGSLPTNEMPLESEKGSDAGHGNRFQSKLLMLFCIRAINAGYKFYLGTELLGQGNKFDDLIFKFKKDEKAGNEGENWPYQYLQGNGSLAHKLSLTLYKPLSYEIPFNKQSKCSCILHHVQFVRLIRTLVQSSGQAIRVVEPLSVACFFVIFC